MTYKELLYVVTICDEGSFSAAAKKLYISQSALSQAVQKLENEYKLMLFIRGGGRTEPTKAGAYFAERGREVLRAWTQFEQEMHVYAQGRQSELSVGMPPMLMKNLLPYVLPRFEREHPDVKLYITEEPSAALEELAMQDAIDLCLIQEPLCRSDLARVPVLSTELLLAVPRGHPFCARHPYRGLDRLETVDLGELRQEPFSLCSHWRVKPVWREIFRSVGFQPAIYRSSRVWNNIKDYVKSGVSVALIDEIVVKYEPDDNKIAYYRFFHGADHRTLLFAAHHPGKKLSRQELWFLDALKRYPSISHTQDSGQ